MIDAKANYEQTREEIGYVSRKKATQADYDRIGFMSGLEVHQQLKTKRKLFCRCPAGDLPEAGRIRCPSDPAHASHTQRTGRIRRNSTDGV
jgi:hypothetical protein